jgi:hypothetical protein
MSPMLIEAIVDQILVTDKNFPEVSIIMPCLNEEDTLAACIGKAKRALNGQKIALRNQRMVVLIMAIRR